jgi:UDP-sulfoquinovose synthase
MQGVVFGTRIDSRHTDPRLMSRLDFDQCFGTAINRFCCQAVIGHPLTVFGSGGQKRGFLPLRDSMQCLALAVENPPDAGEYRVFNQFEACYSVTELAQLVQSVASEMGLPVSIAQYDNPRTEMEDHYYNPDRQHLLDLGYQPTQDIAGEIAVMLADLLPHRERIRQYEAVLVPTIRWDGTRRRSQMVIQTGD